MEIQKKSKNSNVFYIILHVSPAEVDTKFPSLSVFVNQSFVCLVPNGVLTFRRYALPDQLLPKWSRSNRDLAAMHLTTGKRIEDINNALQVNILIFLHMFFI